MQGGPERKKVLIVDDDRDMVLFLSSLMKAGGYKPVSAADAAEGIRKTEKEAPACIILNGMMSGEEGLSLYIDIKSRDDLKAIPVIMLCNLPRKTFFRYRKFRSAQHLGVPEPEAFIENPPEAEELSRLVDELTSEGGRYVG